MENDLENIEQIKHRISDLISNYTTTTTTTKISNHPLLHSYVNHIRNYRELSAEMLNDITEMDDNSKMIFIQEYNKIIESLHRKTESIG